MMRMASFSAFLLASWLLLAAVPAAAGEEVPDAEMICQRLKEHLGPEKPLPGMALYQLSVPHFRHRDRPGVLIPESHLKKLKRKIPNEHTT